MLPQPPALPPANQDAPGSFRLSSQTAPFTRLSPAGIATPTSNLPMPFTEEEYYYVEMQREYSRQWPSVERSPDGKWRFRPGFLQLFVDPFTPAWFSSSSIQRVQYTPLDRCVQAVVLAVYAATAIAAFQLCWAQNYNLALVLAVHFARDKLSAQRLALLLALAWFDKLWIYWICFVGARCDEVLARVAEPLRR
jgi:hypothetical protein